LFVYAFLAGLFKGDMQDKVKVGADVLMKVTLSIGEGSSLNPGRRLISDGWAQDPDDSDEGHGSVA
jgi:hypothetical protein